jgi:4-nitrophenyl phosphatase
MEESKEIVFSDFADLADKYDYFLFDCDGVLWVGSKPVEHSFAALDYLIKTKLKKVFLITNATQRSRKELMLTKLKESYGFDRVPYTQLYTAGYMTAQYVKRVVSQQAQLKGLSSPSVYVVGELGLR